MKTTLKKTLAIFLALFLLLGTGAVSAGAQGAIVVFGNEPLPMKERPLRTAAQGEGSLRASAGELEKGTLRVVAPGAATAQLYCYDKDAYWLNAYDLSGLVIEAGGSKLAAPLEVQYDVVAADKNPYEKLEGKIHWDFYPRLDWDAQPDGWKPGKNKAVLSVEGYQCVRWERVVNGQTEYDYRWESVYWGEASFTIDATDIVYGDPRLDKASAEKLNLGIPAAVEGNGERLFQFTPATSGKYRFWSEGASEALDIDPWGELYDANDNSLEFSHDSQDWNFAIYYTLEAGKTYYLYTGSNDNGGYTVTVDKNTFVLAAPEQITMKVGESVLFVDLFNESTWAISDHRLYGSFGDVVSYIMVEGLSNTARGIYANKAGKASLTVYVPDGESIDIEITVKDTPKTIVKNVLLVILALPLELLFLLFFLPLAPFYWLYTKL